MSAMLGLSTGIEAPVPDRSAGGPTCDARRHTGYRDMWTHPLRTRAMRLHRTRHSQRQDVHTLLIARLTS